MFHIQIRRQKRGEPWQPLGDWKTDLSKLVQPPEKEASESDLLSVRITVPPDSAPALRIYVGTVLVASSVHTDRVLAIDYDDETPYLMTSKGKLLADWAGFTDLIVEVRPNETRNWVRALVLPLSVTAGKMQTEQFNRLFAELQRDSAAVLVDIHGKTQVGMKGTTSLTPSAPAAMLRQLSATVSELNELLHQMAKHPASRLRVQRSRELALLGQAISDSTLAAACRDPSMLARSGSQVVFREHLREHTRMEHQTSEHQIIADFAEFLKSQLVDLRQRIDVEITERDARKRWRNASKGPGQPTWWEAEDYPRIQELLTCRDKVASLYRVVYQWNRFPFLPVGQCLRQAPLSTPIFRNNAVYRRTFRVIFAHFLAYQATLDTHQLLTRARSLPVLYEWWSAVKIIRILTRGLIPLNHDPVAQPVISTRLAQDGKRFTIEFTSDQTINFTDNHGARVRFRYQPHYPARSDTTEPMVVVLDAGAQRTPDMALEITSASTSGPGVPNLIVILDAKYSSQSQREKMTEVTTKYSKIGDAKTGRVLSRHVWALTPEPPASSTSTAGLRSFCTVDNEGFWSEDFEANNPVNGAIQTRPLNPGSYDPLEALIAQLLKQAGVRFDPAQPQQEDHR